MTDYLLDTKRLHSLLECRRTYRGNIPAAVRQYTLGRRKPRMR